MTDGGGLHWRDYGHLPSIAGEWLVIWPYYGAAGWAAHSTAIRCSSITGVSGASDSTTLVRYDGTNELAWGDQAAILALVLQCEEQARKR